MWSDALLAYLHYLSIFTLIVFVTAEAVVLRPDMTPAIRKRLAIYDAVYGASAGAVLISGLLLLFYGAKGVGVLRAQPGLPYQDGAVRPGSADVDPAHPRHPALEGQGKTLPDFVPTPAEIAKVRRWVMLEAHLIIFIPLAAVLMARGIGM